MDIFGDSQLVAKQITGEFNTHNERVTAYLDQSLSLFQSIPSWKITNVSREENQWADTLSKLASSALSSNSEPIYVEERTTPSIDITITNVIHELTDRRQPLLNYIIHDKLPDRKK